MLTCNICNTRFRANSEDHYIARDNCKHGLAKAFDYIEESLYDAFDCPTCGCQIIVNERKRVLVDDLKINEIEGDEDNEQN